MSRTSKLAGHLYRNRDKKFLDRSKFYSGRGDSEREAPAVTVKAVRFGFDRSEVGSEKVQGPHPAGLFRF